MPRSHVTYGSLNYFIWLAQWFHINSTWTARELLDVIATDLTSTSAEIDARLKSISSHFILLQ